MSMTPMQPIEQSIGFTFDSMDFAMSQSSACMVQVSANNPTMEDWEGDDDEEDTETQLGEEEEAEVAVEVDEDLDDEDDQSGEDKEDEVYSDDDDDFEKYLHGDDED